MPDYTTVYRFRHRLDEAALEQTLHAVVQRLASRLSRQVTVAVDATGLTPGAISPFCVKRANDRGAGFTWRHWLQWTMAVDIDHQVILAQTARRGPTHDCASWRPLVSAAHERVPIGVVLADAAFDRERNHQHSRQTLQAHSVIPAKRGAANWKIQGVRIRRHLRKGIDHTEVYTTITTTVVLAAVS